MRSFTEGGAIRARLALGAACLLAAAALTAISVFGAGRTIAWLVDCDRTESTFSVDQKSLASPEGGAAPASEDPSLATAAVPAAQDSPGAGAAADGPAASEGVPDEPSDAGDDQMSDAPDGAGE